MKQISPSQTGPRMEHESPLIFMCISTLFSPKTTSFKSCGHIRQPTSSQLGYRPAWNELGDRHRAPDSLVLSCNDSAWCHYSGEPLHLQEPSFRLCGGYGSVYLYSSLRVVAQSLSWPEFTTLLQVHIWAPVPSWQHSFNQPYRPYPSLLVSHPKQLAVERIFFF